MNSVINEKSTKPMFDKEFLKKVAEDVVNREEEASHFEETGLQLIHFDFEITKAERPILFTGRSGDYYKFNFEYSLTLLDEKGLKSPVDEVRRYKRSLRLAADGTVSAVGERMEIYG